MAKKYLVISILLQARLKSVEDSLVSMSNQIETNTKAVNLLLKSHENCEKQTTEVTDPLYQNLETKKTGRRQR